MRIIFIRHGQTTGDVEDRYGGSYDDVLSTEGEGQVGQLVKELAEHNIQHIYTSSLKRAQQTAQGIAAKTGCSITIVDGLKERDQYGALTGMEKAQAKHQHPDWVEALKDRLNTLPGAESYMAASERMNQGYAEAIAAMKAQGHTCAAIVWHGGGMRVLFRDILKLGELNEIGDCCWVEMEQVSSAWVIRHAQRISFNF